MRRVPVAAAVLVLLGCTYHGNAVLEPSALPPAGSAISRSVLLYMPEEFARYKMRKKKGLSTYEYNLGPAVAQGMLDLMRGTFQRVEERQVPGGTIDQLFRPDTSFDYVAVPRFGDATYRVGAFTMGPSADVSLEFLAQDGRKVTVQGSGRRGAAILPDHDTLATKVVRDILTAIRDDLERQRQSF